MSLDDLNWFEYERFEDTYKQYKLDRGMVDFNDLLERCNIVIPVEVLIIDEAQDLSTLQWQFIERVFADVKRRYIAGDDDQSIYSWSGADTEYFQNIVGQREVLTQSYRIPKAIHDLAETISGKIQLRTEKEYKPRDEVGAVEYWRDLGGIDMSQGSWLLLARNGYLLPQLVRFAQDEGFNYTIKGEPGVNASHLRAIKLWEKRRAGEVLTTKELLILNEFSSEKNPSVIWHEAFTKLSIEKRELYISLLRRGESLGAPRIHINTIHGVKGGEADNVILMTDYSYTTWDAMNLDPDAEHRVWYVGATRAKESLHIISPQSRYAYEL
jgi:DNA helicase-2/ATP-dependent DNA helicase PcrA